MLRFTLPSIIIISSLLFVISCGNLVNDELSGDEHNKTDIVSGSNRFGTVIERNFSTAGRIKIQSASDEGYFISGTIIGDGGRDELWLSYIDKNANRVWSATLNNLSTNDRISRIEVIDSDNIFILADRYYPDAEADVIVIKVNSSRGIVWQKCIGNEKKNIVSGIAPADDGGLLAVGITITKETEDTTAEYRPFVLRISPDGDIVWKKDYRIYLNKSGKKYFEIVTPVEIISLGNEEYLFSGTAVNPDNNKLAGFYCRIDGREAGISDDYTPYGGGLLLKACYVKAGNNTITMLGCISFSDSLVSVIAVTGSSDTSTAVKYKIMSMNKETLKVISKKNYEFESFRIQSGIIRNNSDDFTIAGMIKPSAGKGIYTITFDKSGVVKELHTKYYDNIAQDFLSIEFNKIYENSELSYVIKLYTPGGDERDLFIDRYITPSVSALSVPKVVINKAAVVTVTDDSDIAEEDGDADIEEFAIADITDPGLVFNRY